MARAALVLAVAVLAACGGGGGGGSDSAPQPVGTLTVGGCTIAEGASSCPTTVAWTTSGAAAPRVQVGPATLSTGASGSATATIGIDPVSVAVLDGTARLAERTIRGECASASTWDGTACRAYAMRSVVRAPTPFVENGRALTLEVVLFAPLSGAGPFPTVMFNHGSTGNGDDPSQFTITYVNENVARFFVQRGWMVAFPQRRGRGAPARRRRFRRRRCGSTAGTIRSTASVTAAATSMRSPPPAARVRSTSTRARPAWTVISSSTIRRCGPTRWTPT